MFVQKLNPEFIFVQQFIFCVMSPLENVCDIATPVTSAANPYGETLISILEQLFYENLYFNFLLNIISDTRDIKLNRIIFNMLTIRQIGLKNCFCYHCCRQ